MEREGRSMKITRSLLLGLALAAPFSAIAGFEDFYQGRIWSVFIDYIGPHFVDNDKLMLLGTTDGRVRAIPLDGMTRRAAWRANKAGLNLQKIRLNDQEYLCADNVYLHDSRAHVFVFK